MLPVSVRGLVKSYDGRTRVLDQIDVEIAAGELFFLLGGSGCGKTTLLRLIAGFLTPDQGTIRFADQDVTRLPAERREIGMVFQNYALWPHLDVAGNVAFGLDVRGVAKGERQRRVDEALALVELSGYGARRVAELSGGQQQRVALARAIVVRPKLLLLDEPLSNLDARLRTQMRSEIRRVCKAAGVTAIYVTHDQHEALSTADRIAVMAGGRIAQIGTPRELYLRPQSRTVAEFLGEANLVPATVCGPDALDCALGRLRINGPLPALGTRVLACIRPERVRLGDGGTDGNRLHARVADGQFFGDQARWRLVVGEVSVLASEAAPPERQAGDLVTVHIAPGDVAVLPDTP